MAVDNSPFGIIDPASLSKIDRLFACNVGEYVALPQLVVVGDQSSGKSSVLEGLTELPFPRDSNLCTRFATQIIFRRTPETEIIASIIPDVNSTESHRERVMGWSRTLPTLDAGSFADIMEDVKDTMEIDRMNNETKRTFSADVLRLEVSGPNQEHFSIIDVPGIFKRTTHGITTKEDRSMVDLMVRGYMENPRSVMLTVVPCNVDIATQEILQRAEEVDPAGIRTLGVLTKPDLADKGTEHGVVDLVEGRRYQLHLGWHLLRNPGQSDLDNPISSRQDIEREFFATESPWNQLGRDKTGVHTLRTRLQDIMAHHIRREFPKVKAEINQRLKAAMKGIGDLGPKRQTTAEQGQFLMAIALKFQELASVAVRSEYGHSDLFSKRKNLRLATAVINRGDMFADRMGTAGHVFEFNTSTADIPDAEEDDSEELSTGKPKGFNARTEIDHPDVADLAFVNVSLSPAYPNGIISWLKKAQLESRGFELGTFKASLLGITMKEQSQKWPALALGYISDIVMLVHTVITGLLQEITPNEAVRYGIENMLIDDLRKRYEAAISHTEFLLKVELESNPATHNHYFNDTLEKCRQERLRNAMEEKSFFDRIHGTVVKLNDIAQSHPLSNTDHVVVEIHDILRSYYKLARKRFVDCVRMQVADFLLTTGPDTPLSLFSPASVAAMSAEQLEEVAGEDARTKRQRSQLEMEVKQLEEGKKILT